MMLESGVEVGKSGAAQPESWKSSKSFMLKLGCMSRDCVRAPIDRMTDFSVQVSQEYTITGYQEGKDAVPSLVEVNSAILVSLEPEAVGEVLGIEYAGDPVVKVLTKEGRAHLLRHLTKKPKNARVLVDSFHPSDLREYIRQRKQKLMILENDSSKLPITQAFFMKQEFHFGVRYNWAAFKVDHLKLAFKKGWLSRPVKAILGKYITAVAPSVYHVCEGRVPRPRVTGQTDPAHATTGTHPTAGEGTKRSARQTENLTASDLPTHAPSTELEPDEGTEIDAVKQARLETKEVAMLGLKLLAYEREFFENCERRMATLERDRAKLQQRKEKLARAREQLRMRKLEFHRQIASTSSDVFSV